MKLNLGCGFRQLEGYVNVDKEALCAPDAVVNLESFPWPWPDGSVSEIVADHCLEHLGAETSVWTSILKEIWRVCRPDALIKISVPHPRHDNFIHDPTHVRVITPVGLAMFDQERNFQDWQNGGQETKLGLFTGIDLEVIGVRYDLHEPWRTQLEKGEITPEQMDAELGLKNNVCHQIRIILRAVKPCRRAGWFPPVRERHAEKTDHRR